MTSSNKTKSAKDSVNNHSPSPYSALVRTKSLAIIFNLLLILNGVSLILLSIYTINSKQDYIDLFTPKIYQASTYLIITSGALVIIIR